ncbi:hypothetical protein J4227_07110 [Candidatus Woesearchaeota archaeon]|nr:hypothetical protein [Candidatus Woesearchaeota archaeon]
MSKDEMELLIALVMENITIMPENEVKGKMEEAIDIMKDIDIKDAPILACALAVKCDAIWSEDAQRKVFNELELFRCREMLNELISSYLLMVMLCI